MKRLEVHVQGESEGCGGEDGEDECGKTKTHGGGMNVLGLAWLLG